MVINLQTILQLEIKKNFEQFQWYQNTKETGSGAEDEKRIVKKYLTVTEKANYELLSNKRDSMPK